jgi:hypothetical protein
MKTTQATKGTQVTFDRARKFLQKERSAANKQSIFFKSLYDFPLMTMTKRLSGIKKSFAHIAFVGPNPDLFLLHMPKTYEVKKFTFIEQTDAQVQSSYNTITEKIDSGFFEKNGVNLPEEIEPAIQDDELWPYEASSFDLIVNNM